MVSLSVCCCVDGRPLWLVNRFDFVTWTVTYVVTTFVSITVGLGVGVALSCLLAVVQSQRAARGRRLTRAADTEIYFCRSRSTATTTTTTTTVSPPSTVPAGVVVYRSVSLPCHVHLAGA